MATSIFCFLNLFVLLYSIVEISDVSLLTFKNYANSDILTKELVRI